MPKVINTILSYAFKSLKLLEIKAGYEKKNLASAKVFEKCGFEIVLNNNKTRTVINVKKMLK